MPHYYFGSNKVNERENSCYSGPIAYLVTLGFVPDLPSLTKDNVDHLWSNLPFPVGKTPAAGYDSDELNFSCPDTSKGLSKFFLNLFGDYPKQF